MLLAFLRLPDDGWTAVVHPARLADIRHLEELPRPTRAVPQVWHLAAAVIGPFRPLVEDTVKAAEVRRE
jgi:hypothetical protein